MHVLISTHYLHTHTSWSSHPCDQEPVEKNGSYIIFAAQHSQRQRCIANRTSTRLQRRGHGGPWTRKIFVTLTELFTPGSRTLQGPVLSAQTHAHAHWSAGETLSETTASCVALRGEGRSTSACHRSTDSYALKTPGYCQERPVLLWVNCSIQL